MADYACIYTLTTSGGTIYFNDGTFGFGSRDDLYWLDNIHGLDGPVLRVPTDDVPFGDGGLIHRSFKGPRHPVPEGRMIVQSTGLSGCQARFNEMEEALKDVLEAAIAPNSGTLAWTPAGGSGHNITVYYERGLEITPADSYRTRGFDFGLFAPSADT